MMTNKQEALLAIYLSLLPHTVSFSHHREHVHSSEGFLIDSSGLTQGDIVKPGGSLEELAEFVKVAVESAKVVNRPGDISRFFESNKRKVKDNENNSDNVGKKSKSETVDGKEVLEIREEKGLEMEYQHSTR